jgi:hypothetical protein
VREVYAGLIGETDVEMLRQAEKLGAQYGLVVRQRPSGEYKQELSRYIETALAASRDGGNSLELPDAMLIREKMWRGENLTAIRQEVAYHIRKAKKEYEQKQQALVQQQQDGMMQQEQMKIQSEQAKAQMEAQQQMALKAFDVAVARVTNNHKFIDTIMAGENNGAERVKLERALKQVAMMGGLDKVDLALVYANVDMLEQAQNQPQAGNMPV